MHVTMWTRIELSGYLEFSLTRTPSSRLVLVRNDEWCTKSKSIYTMRLIITKWNWSMGLRKSEIRNKDIQPTKRYIYFLPDNAMTMEELHRINYKQWWISSLTHWNTILLSIQMQKGKTLENWRKNIYGWVRKWLAGRGWLWSTDESGKTKFNEMCCFKRKKNSLLIFHSFYPSP